MKLKYYNVGSIKDAEVEYKPGQLVAIVGESNQGKSLQFYSLLDGFTNSPSFKRYINNEALAKDSKACESIELIDDENKSWQVVASTTSLSYKIDGIKYEKPGRKSLFELTNRQIPGLLYDPENCTPIMNIVDEDTGMFPIDRSDAQIFKTYERLLSLSCTEDILRAIKLDIEDIDYNITDRLKTIQQNEAILQKLSDFFANIDENLLNEAMISLKQLKEKQDALNFIYNNSVKSLQYIDAVFKIEDTKNDFDLKDFENKLAVLIQANKLIQYYSKVDQSKIEVLKDFNIQKVINLSQILSKAMQLTQDIDYLDKQIIEDSDKLKGIELNIKDIKVCPLCGHIMED